MKALATIMGIIAPATAFAASGAAGEGSGMFVWVFLGFFALVVVGQSVPAAMLITGMVKGLLSKTENTKRTLTAVVSVMTLSLVTSTTAFASSGATSKVFVSGPLILLFLGFCALVVVIQCIPAMIMLYGMIKGVISTRNEELMKIKK